MEIKKVLRSHSFLQGIPERCVWCINNTSLHTGVITEVFIPRRIITSRYRTTWIPELAQDVSAFHNIDAEAELTALLSEQVATEIDREILNSFRITPPMGQLFYLDYIYGEQNIVNNPFNFKRNLPTCLLV